MIRGLFLAAAILFITPALTAGRRSLLAEGQQAVVATHPRHDDEVPIFHIGVYEGARRKVLCTEGGYLRGVEAQFRTLAFYHEPIMVSLRLICSSGKVSVSYMGSIPDTFMFGHPVNTTYTKLTATCPGESGVSGLAWRYAGVADPEGAPARLAGMLIQCNAATQQAGGQQQGAAADRGAGAALVPAAWAEGVVLRLDPGNPPAAAAGVNGTGAALAAAEAAAAALQDFGKPASAEGEEGEEQQEGDEQQQESEQETTASLAPHAKDQAYTHWLSCKQAKGKDYSSLKQPVLGNFIMWFYQKSISAVDVLDCVERQPHAAEAAA